MMMHQAVIDCMRRATTGVAGTRKERRAKLSFDLISFSALIEHFDTTFSCSLVARMAAWLHAWIIDGHAHDETALNLVRLRRGVPVTQGALHVAENATRRITEDETSEAYTPRQLQSGVRHHRREEGNPRRHQPLGRNSCTGGIFHRRTSESSNGLRQTLADVAIRLLCFTCHWAALRPEIPTLPKRATNDFCLFPRQRSQTMHTRQLRQIKRGKTLPMHAPEQRPIVRHTLRLPSHQHPSRRELTQPCRARPDRPVQPARVGSIL